MLTVCSVAKYVYPFVEVDSYNAWFLVSKEIDWAIASLFIGVPLSSISK